MSTIGEKLAAALAGQLVLPEGAAEASDRLDGVGESARPPTLVDEQLMEAKLVQSVYDALLASSSHVSIDFAGHGLREDLESVMKAYSRFPHELLSHQELRAFCRDAGMERFLPTVELDLIWTRVLQGEMKRFGLPALKTKGLGLEHFAWALALTVIEMNKRQRGALSSRGQGEEQESALTAELVASAAALLNGRKVKHFVEPIPDPAPLLSESGIEAINRAGSLIQALFVHYSEGEEAGGRETMMSPLMSSPQQRKLERRTSRSSFSVLGSSSGASPVGGASSPTAASVRMSIVGGPTARTSVTWTQGGQSQLQPGRAASVVGSTAGPSLETRLMPFEKFTQFVLDFGILPDLITKRQLHAIFAATATGRDPFAGGVSLREEENEDDDVQVKEEKFLRYPGFLEAFGRIALTAYGPASKHGDMFPSAGSKIDALCDRLLAKRELLDSIVVKQKKEAKKSGFLPTSPAPAFGSSSASVTVRGASPTLPTPPLSSARRTSMANLALVSGALGSAFSSGTGKEAFAIPGSSPTQLQPVGAPQGKSSTPPSVPGLNLTRVSPGAPPTLAGGGGSSPPPLIAEPVTATETASVAAPPSQAAPRSPPPPPARYSFGSGSASGRGMGSPPPPNPPSLSGRRSSTEAPMLPLPSTPTGSSTARTGASLSAENTPQREHYEGDVYGYTHYQQAKRDSGRSAGSDEAARRSRRRSSGDLPPMPVSARSTSPEMHESPARQQQQQSEAAATATVPSPATTASPAPPPLPAASPAGVAAPAAPAAATTIFSPSPRVATIRALSSRGKGPALETLPEHSIEGDEEGSGRRGSLPGASTAAISSVAGALKMSPTAAAALAGGGAMPQRPYRRATSTGDVGALDSLSSYSLLDSASVLMGQARGLTSASVVGGGSAALGGTGSVAGRRATVSLGYKDFSLAGSLAASQIAAASGVVIASPPVAGGAAGPGGAGGARPERRASTTLRRATVDSASPIPIPIRPLKAMAAVADAVEKGLAPPGTGRPSGLGARQSIAGKDFGAASKEAAVGYRVDPVVVDRLCAELGDQYLQRLYPLFRYYSAVRDPGSSGDRCSTVNFFRLLKDIGDVFDADVTVGDVQLQLSLVLSKTMVAAKERRASSLSRPSMTRFSIASAGGPASHRSSFSRSLTLPQFFEALVRVSELIRRSVNIATAAPAGASLSEGSTVTPSAKAETRRSMSVDRLLGRRASLSAANASTDDLLRGRRPSFGLRAFMSAGPSSSAGFGAAAPGSAEEAAILKAVADEETAKREARERKYQAARSVCQAFLETRVLPLYAASGLQQFELEGHRPMFRADAALADAVSEHAPFLIKVFKHYSTEIVVLESSQQSPLRSPSPLTGGAAAAPRSSPTSRLSKPPQPILALFLPRFLEMMKDLGLAPGLLSFLEMEHLFLDTARRAGTGGSTASLAFAAAQPIMTTEAEGKKETRGLFAIQDAKDEKRSGPRRSPSPPAMPGFESRRRGGGRVFDEAALARAMATANPSPTSSVAARSLPIPAQSASFDAIATRKFLHSGAFLNFFPFVEAFSALAMIAFSRPHLAEFLATPADKLAAAFHWCYSAGHTLSKIEKEEKTSKAAGKQYTIAQLTGEASPLLAATLEKTGRLVRLARKSDEAEEEEVGEETEEASFATASPPPGAPATEREDVRVAAARAARLSKKKAKAKLGESALDISEVTPQKMTRLLKVLATGDKRWLKSDWAAPQFAASERNAKEIKVNLFQQPEGYARYDASSPLHPAMASRDAELSAFTHEEKSQHQVAKGTLLSPEPHGRPRISTAPRDSAGGGAPSILGLSAIADLPMSINDLLAGLPSSQSSSGGSIGSGSSSSSSSAETRKSGINTAKSIDGCVALCRLLGLDVLKAYDAARYACTQFSLSTYPSATTKKWLVGRGGEAEDSKFHSAVNHAVHYTMQILRLAVSESSKQKLQGESGERSEEEESTLLVLSDALVLQAIRDVPDSLFSIAAAGEQAKEVADGHIKRQAEKPRAEGAIKPFLVAPLPSEMARAVEVLAAGLQKERQAPASAARARAEQRKSTATPAEPLSDISKELMQETEKLLRASGGRASASARRLSADLMHPQLFGRGVLQFVARQSRGRDARASLSPDKGVITRSTNLVSPKRASSAGFAGPASPVHRASQYDAAQRMSRHSLRVDVTSLGTGSVGRSEGTRAARSPTGRYSPGRLSFMRPPPLFEQSPKAQAEKMMFADAASQRSAQRRQTKQAAAFTTPSQEDLPRGHFDEYYRAFTPYGGFAMTEPRPLVASLEKLAEGGVDSRRSSVPATAAGAPAATVPAEAQQPQPKRAERLVLEDFGLESFEPTDASLMLPGSPSAHQRRLAQQASVAARLALPSPRHTETDTVMLVKAKDGTAKFVGAGTRGRGAATAGLAGAPGSNVVLLQRKSLRSPTTGEAIQSFSTSLRKSGAPILPATALRTTKKASPTASETRSPRLSALMLAAGMRDTATGTSSGAAGTATAMSSAARQQPAARRMFFDVEGGGTPSSARNQQQSENKGMPAPYARGRGRARDMILSSAKQEEERALKEAQTRQTPFPRKQGYADGAKKPQIGSAGRGGSYAALARDSFSAGATVGTSARELLFASDLLSGSSASSAPQSSLQQQQGGGVGTTVAIPSDRWIL
jgi:hypothetical protein